MLPDSYFLDHLQGRCAILKSLKKSYIGLLKFKALQCLENKDFVSRGLSPCPARPGYIQFQADFKPNNISLKWIILFVVDAQSVK